MRTIDWDVDTDGNVSIALIDQTLLPGETTMRHDSSVADLIVDIKRLAVRGAPALGVAGAFGVALALHESADLDTAKHIIKELREARPTAVNLAWGVDQACSVLDQGFDAVLAKAKQVRDDDIAASAHMASAGADLLERLLPAKREHGFRLMTICNTGSLAAVEGGTALGVIREIHHRGLLKEAIACETRPLFQGARLTAWELEQMGAPYKTIVDSAANFLLSLGDIDAVLVGADRIAANGDTANKVGTFSLSLGAKYAGIPFIVVAPESTIDLETKSGSDIEIEDRGTDEVVVVNGVRVSPEQTQSINPAFDVTPSKQISYIVTDERVIDLAQGATPADQDRVPAS